MNPAIEQLESEWQEMRAQLDEIKAEYDALCAKRSCFYGTFIFAKDNSPEAEAEFQERCKAEVAEWSLKLPELEQEIKAANLKMKKARAKLAVKQIKLYELEAEENWQKLAHKANAINQLTEQIEGEIQEFWRVAHNFSPRLEDWLPEQPKLAFCDKIPAVPRIKQTENSLELGEKQIDLEPK